MRVIAVATPKDKPGASIGPGRQRYFEGAKMSDNHAAVHDSLRRRLAAASCVASSARPFTRIFRIQSTIGDGLGRAAMGSGTTLNRNNSAQSLNFPKLLACS